MNSVFIQHSQRKVKETFTSNNMATTLTVVHNSTCTRCRPVRGFFVVAVVVFIHSENITKMSSQTKYTLHTKITVLGNPASKPNHTVPLRTRRVPVAAALRV